MQGMAWLLSHHWMPNDSRWHRSYHNGMIIYYHFMSDSYKSFYDFCTACHVLEVLVRGCIAASVYCDGVSLLRIGVMHKR